MRNGANGAMTGSGWIPSLTRRPFSQFVLVGVLSLQLLVFGLHVARYGWWIVDDAGISLAYSRNLAEGHGLVAQPGLIAVEGFSNPTWVFLFALPYFLGFLNGGQVFGVTDFVLLLKSFTLICHIGVLISLRVVTRQLQVRDLFDSRNGDAVETGVWLGSGLLLSLNPGYVIWMVSGLENPLLTALVTAMAALMMMWVARPSGRLGAAIGLLLGLIALTRPDGALYAVVVIPCMAILGRQPLRDTLRSLLPGVAALVGVVGTYLVFRVTYFGALLPNTAVAKDQGLPGLSSILRLREIPTAYGGALLILSGVGGTACAWRHHRNRDAVALRSFIALVVVLCTTLAVFTILEPDWMGEYRFLTPAWPLLATGSILGLAWVVRLALHPTAVRPLMAVLLSLILVAVGFDLSKYSQRSAAFRDSPTLSLCLVADRYGLHFNTAAAGLGLTGESTSVLLPDLGGTLLVSDLRVDDLAGLVDRRIARMIGEGDREALADYVFGDLRPSFIHIGGDWDAMSGLGGDPRFNRDYVEMVDESDYVRRDAVSGLPGGQLEEVAALMTRNADEAWALNDEDPGRDCPGAWR